MVAGMAWRFRSPLFDNDRPKVDWPHFWRAMRTRDGKLQLFEGGLFLLTAAVELWMILDFVQTGSLQSLITVALLFLLTLWPFLRHRLWHGDWPQSPARNGLSGRGGRDSEGLLKPAWNHDVDPDHSAAA